MFLRLLALIRGQPFFRHNRNKAAKRLQEKVEQLELLKEDSTLLDVERELLEADLARCKQELENLAIIEAVSRKKAALKWKA